MLPYPGDWWPRKNLPYLLLLKKGNTEMDDEELEDANRKKSEHLWRVSRLIYHQERVLIVEQNDTNFTLLVSAVVRYSRLRRHFLLPSRRSLTPVQTVSREGYDSCCLDYGSLQSVWCTVSSVYSLQSLDHE